MSGGMGGGEAGVDVEMLTTKGDTHGFDTDNARVPIGANTTVLTADSTEALGLKWATPAAGYTQPTLGTTVIPSNTTVATLDGLTLTDLIRSQLEIGTTLGTTGTINLDFTLNEIQLMPAMTGAVVFTGSNYVAGASKTIRIIGGTTAYGFTFPAGWKFLDSQIPENLAIGKYAVLTLTSLSTDEANVVCEYRLESTPLFDVSDLYAYYKFDAASGNILNKASDVGSSSQIASTDMVITGATYSESGIIDNALSFDGTNDYGELGSSLSNWNFFHGTGDWSINLWLYLPQVSTEGKVFSNLDSTELRGINFEATRNATKIALSIKSDSGFMVNNSMTVGTVPLNSWFMATVVADYSAATYTIYINGVDKGNLARAVTGTTGNAEYSLKTMVRGNAADRFVDGLQDETSIWGRILTATEITSLYNSGSALAISGV